MLRFRRSLPFAYMPFGGLFPAVDAEVALQLTLENDK